MYFVFFLFSLYMFRLPIKFIIINYDSWHTNDTRVSMIHDRTQARTARLCCINWRGCRDSLTVRQGLSHAPTPDMGDSPYYRGWCHWFVGRHNGTSWRQLFFFSIFRNLFFTRFFFIENWIIQFFSICVRSFIQHLTVLWRQLFFSRFLGIRFYWFCQIRIIN